LARPGAGSSPDVARRFWFSLRETLFSDQYQDLQQGGHNVLLDINEESAQGLMTALGWNEWERDGLAFALCLTDQIAHDGVFKIVLSSTGQEIYTCDGWPELCCRIGALEPGIYHVLLGNRKVVVLVPPDKSWRLFVNRYGPASDLALASSQSTSSPLVLT
jgi:hypothetical protein